MNFTFRNCFLCALLCALSAAFFFACNDDDETQPVLPELTTTAISAITVSGAQSGGSVTTDGGASITARGICWSTAQAPTVDDSRTTDGTGTGNFISALSALEEGTTYYVRAYATNSVGTAYGNEVSFTTVTIVLPELTTTDVTEITAETAASGGEITDAGGAEISARGVCWSQTPNPTINDSKTNDDTGAGTFVSALSELEENTTYYVRAYATNSAGTAYGNEVTFTTGYTTYSTITNVTCPGGVNCQDVYEITFKENSTVTFTINNVTNGGQIQVALYAPGVSLGGTNLFSGTNQESACLQNNCNLGGDGITISNFTITTAGTYRFAVTRNWGYSCNAGANYLIKVASNKVITLSQAIDDTKSLAAETPVCQ